MQNFCLSDSIFERLQDAEKEIGLSARVEQVNSDDIELWEYLDEHVSGSDEIHRLGMNILQQGQCLPVIVVKRSEQFQSKSNQQAKYILLSGIKRWLACKQFKLPLLVFERQLQFNQAVNLFLFENEKQNLSDYSRGMFYYKLINGGSMDSEMLRQKLGISHTMMNNYLAFGQIPAQVWDAIGDLSQISAGTAQTIKRLLNKGLRYKQAILAISDKIAAGFGSKRIKDLVEAQLQVPFCRQDEQPQTHLEYAGKVLMKCQGTRLELAKSITQSEQYQELIANINQVLVKYFDDHLK